MKRGVAGRSNRSADVNCEKKKKKKARATMMAAQSICTDWNACNMMAVDGVTTIHLSLRMCVREEGGGEG